MGTGDIHLSPALSLDGTQVAFVETANHPFFDVLTWVRGQGTDATHPVVPGTGGSSVTRLDYTNTSVSGCSASPTRGNSNSSPYIDYTNNAAYVGANNGFLYRINNVFHGVPTSAYCIQVASNKDLTSPVFDSVSGKVFVSDGASLFAFIPGASSFTAAGSITVSSPSKTVLFPIVDSTNQFVYIFSEANAANTNSIVSQMPTSLATHVDANIGPTSNQFIFDGDFDNNYFASGPSAGTLYACGVNSTGAGVPALFTMTFQSNGVMNSSPVMSNNTNIDTVLTTANCSPLMELFDGTHDRLFVGSGLDNNTTGSNVVTMWDISTRITSSSTGPAATPLMKWGEPADLVSITLVQRRKRLASISARGLRTRPLLADLIFFAR